MSAGLFVSFEGIDGSGKSTQARLLADRLRGIGRDVELTREPGGSPGAEEIRRLLVEGPPDRWSPETEVLLFTAARRDHLERRIQPALARGAVVISDRFADSTRVYQGAVRGDLTGLVDRLHDLAIGIEPDLTFLIDTDPARAHARSVERLASAPGVRPDIRPDASPPAPGPAFGAIRPREDRFETLGAEFQSRLRESFHALAAMHPDRIVAVDGDRDPDVIAAEILSRVRARL